MPNLQASIKDLRKTKRKTVYNARLRERVRKAMKSFETLVSAGEIEKAQAVLPRLTKVLDKAAKKKVVKKQKASRKVSRLTKKLNTIKTAANVENTKKST